MKDQFQGYSIGQTPGLVAVSMRAALSLLMGEPVPKAVSVPLPEAKTDELVPGVNVFPDAPDNFFTATSDPRLRGKSHFRGGRRAAGLDSREGRGQASSWRLAPGRTARLHAQTRRVAQMPCRG